MKSGHLCASAAFLFLYASATSRTAPDSVSSAIAQKLHHRNSTIPAPLPASAPAPALPPVTADDNSSGVVARDIASNSTNHALLGDVQARRSRTQREATPRIYLLFLTIDYVQRFDIWRRWLDGVPSDRYRLLWHCKNPGKCRAALNSAGYNDKDRMPVIVDPPMPTEYCTDLVSAENRLLEAALQQEPKSASSSLLQKGGRRLRKGRVGGPSQYDKFVFVSNSTLPVKPFHEVYSTLTAKADSRFCVFPQQEWAVAPHEPCLDKSNRCGEWAGQGECSRNPLYMHFQCERACEVCTDLAVIKQKAGASGSFVAAKVHEWKVLNRPDAEESVDLWRRGYLRHLMQSLHLNWHDSYQNTGCLDEFWHFAALYGMFPEECLEKADIHPRCDEWANRGECNANPEYMLHNCQASCAGCNIPRWKFRGGEPFQLKSNEHSLQGTCDTFVKWSLAGAMGENNPMADLDQQLLTIGDIKTLDNEGQRRPDTITVASSQSLKAFRDSGFLFARKIRSAFSITDDCRPTADIWSEKVFGQSSSSHRQSWIGEGVWIDEVGQAVSVTNDPSQPTRIVIQNGFRPQLSGWATVCGEQLSVIFGSQLAKTAYLDASHGNSITFSDGIVWHRDLPWRGDGQWRDTYQNPVSIRTWGGQYSQITSVNPDWSAQGVLDAPSANSFSATFNKKDDKGKQIQLWGWLQEDGNTIRWHNGHMWTRDPSYRPPCICEPDSSSWRPAVNRPVSTPEPRCFFIDLGAGEMAADDISALLSKRIDIKDFAPQECKAYMFEADSRYESMLSSLERQQPQMITTMSSTAAYSCTPPPSEKAEMYGNQLRGKGSGGWPTNTVNILKFIRELALPTDHVILKMDIGGTQWDILPCLARSTTARLIDVIYFKDVDEKASSFGTIASEKRPTLERLQQFGIKVMQY